MGGKVDFRVDGATEGGLGVVRFSGGGIVDFREEPGVPEGGRGVVRFSGGIVERREDAGSTDERAAPASSSPASSVSAFRGSTAGICAEERRDEPRGELCGSGPSGGVFHIVTALTLVEFSQRVIPSRHEREIPSSLEDCVKIAIRVSIRIAATHAVFRRPKCRPLAPPVFPSDT